MKKIALIIAVFSIVVFGAAAAVDVSRQELESAVPNPDIIEFINYSGPHSRIDTKEQILDIGRCDRYFYVFHSFLLLIV